MATDLSLGSESQTIRAAILVLGFAVVIGFTDNYVRVVAEDAGLWQFHAVRTAMSFGLIALVAPVFGLRIRPRRLGPVVLRSLVHGTAMVIYFGSLAFMPVATAAAGLFTAPIFTLLISRFAFGVPIGPYRIAAAILGFAGVILVLGPGQGAALGPASVLPLLAGALYALGNIATRRWCGGEAATTLLMGFFTCLGLFGLIGMAVLAVWQPDAPEGVEGFLLRGPVWPTPRFLFWTFVQAAGSLIGVAMVLRAYQITEATRVAIFEYVILPASALWAWAIWAEVLSAGAILGMAMIFVSGLVIALRGA